MCPVLVCVYSVRPWSSYFSPSHITTRSLRRQPVVSALCTIWLGWVCASEGQRRYGGGSYFIPTYISHHLLDVERRAASALLAFVAFARAMLRSPHATPFALHRGTSEHVPVRLDTSDHSVGAGTPRAPTGNGHESSAGIGGRASGHPGTITATRSGPEGCSSGGGPFYRRSELGDHEAPRIRGVLSRSQRSWAYPRSPAGPECAHRRIEHVAQRRRPGACW